MHMTRERRGRLLIAGDRFPLERVYSPKTVGQTRRLIEEDQVALLFQNLETPTNTAMQRYVNQKNVPHLFISTGADNGAIIGISADNGLPAQLPNRVANLYEIHDGA